eukprot:11157279-Lingulodinium_polyedra.AAC.1
MHWIRPGRVGHACVCRRLVSGRCVRPSGPLVDPTRRPVCRPMSGSGKSSPWWPPPRLGPSTSSVGWTTA